MTIDGVAQFGIEMNRAAYNTASYAVHEESKKVSPELNCILPHKTEEAADDRPSRKYFTNNSRSSYNPETDHDDPEESGRIIDLYL